MAIPRLAGRTILLTLLLVAFGIAIQHPLGRALSLPSTNGFELDGGLVPADEIHHGGPPRDGIPAIDAPNFISPDEAHFLRDDDRVLGLSRGGLSKAYPIRILNYHEIVNDRLAGEPIVVTYCPLCGTGVTFLADVAGTSRTFGVSGLLYNSDVLLYDRQSESLWSQLLGKAVTGPMQGTPLQQIPSSHTTWADWRARHPDTLVLSTETGHRRDYTSTPYQGYETSSALYFPVSNVRRDYHPKELVIGLELNGTVKAYPFAELSQGPDRLRERLAGKNITVEFDPANRTGRVLDEQGMEVPTTIAYWFAWTAFHPDTEVFTAPE